MAVVVQFGCRVARFDCGVARFDFQGWLGLNGIRSVAFVAANQLDSTMTGDEMGGDDEWPFGFDGGCSA